MLVTTALQAFPTGEELTDYPERLILADLMQDNDRDKEAELLRNPVCRVALWEGRIQEVRKVFVLEMATGGFPVELVEQTVFLALNETHANFLGRKWTREWFNKLSTCHLERTGSDRLCVSSWVMSYTGDGALLTHLCESIYE